MNINEIRNAGKGNRMIKKALLFICAMFILCAFTVPGYAAYFSFNAGCDNNLDGWGGGKVQNQLSTDLPVGSVIQYIYAGPDGAIQAPDANGNVTGDDVLLGTATVGSDNVWSGFSNVAGTFYNGYTAAYTAASPKIYVRAWNSTAIGSSSYYGNSALFSPATDANNPPIPNDTGLASFKTSAPFVAVPAFTSITPSSGTVGTTVPVTIVGANTNFVNGTTAVTFTASGVTASNISVTNATTLTCNVVIASGAATGATNVVVTTGAEVVTGTGKFTVNAIGAPTFSTIVPSSGKQGTVVSGATITGANTNFVNGTTTVTFGNPGVTASNISVTNAGTLTCDITITSGAVTGQTNVVVTTGAETVTGTNAFTVNSSGGNNIYETAGGIMMAYPNPFNPNDKAHPLSMLFGVTAGDTVNIYIFDSNGRIIYQDRDSQTNADRIVTWDGISSYGQMVDNGIYLIRVVKDGKLVAKGKKLAKGPLLISLC